MKLPGTQTNARNLDKIFNPRRIALVGDQQPSSCSQLTILKNLTSGGFGGAVYPIGTEAEAIQGIPSFPDLLSLPHLPDLALICSPAPDVPRQVEECAKAGIRAMTIFSAGFRESGAAGIALEERIEQIAAAFGDLRIIGPNSLGVIAPHSGLNASLAVT
jgi:acetyltransferase